MGVSSYIDDAWIYYCVPGARFYHKNLSTLSKYHNIAIVLMAMYPRSLGQHVDVQHLYSGQIMCPHRTSSIILK